MNITTFFTNIIKKEKMFYEQTVRRIADITKLEVK